MTSTNPKRALGRGIQKTQLSNEVRKLVFKGMPLLSDEDKAELDEWVGEFKKKRFGKSGYESWLAEHTAD